MIKKFKVQMVAFVTSAAMCIAVEAQEVSPPSLIIELNAAKAVDGACRLSFLVRNEHPSDITKAVFETVLFDKSGAVSQLTLFDFGILPVSRPRIRQFDVGNTTCADVSQILINGATTCEVDAAASDLCATTLELRSRTQIEVIG